MKKHFATIAKTSLILVYLVIVAGASVRMTGSGMGCPDWPKCFGYYIPPTDIVALTWAANRQFESGQLIVKDEKLLVANEDFITGDTFDESRWSPYTKHDYAIFNPLHTWIEYLNRLVGALAGLAVLIMAIFSLKFWVANKRVTMFSWLALLLMGFQGWLGANVVYSVLNPVKITVHMIVALIIVAVILYIIREAQSKPSALKYDSLFRNLLWCALFLTLIQIVFGTQVRQFVDEQVKVLGYDQMESVLRNPTVGFYVHRTFSILIFLLNLFLFIRNRKYNLGFDKINWVIGLIGIEIISGMAMYYFHFPFGSQAVHLIIASVLFGIQFWMGLAAQKAQKKMVIE